MSLRISNTVIVYPDNPKFELYIDILEFNDCINFLVGKNGSGKSTLLKALSKINNELTVKGDIQLDGNPLQNFNVGLVSQNPIQSINSELTFLENIALAHSEGYKHISLLPNISKSESEFILKFLQSFTNWNLISELVHRESRNLSAGQQQMLAILMRVIRFQKLLLLDECTANLDTENSKIIIDILLELVNKGTIVIFATHQTELLETKNSKTYKVEYGTIKNQ